MSTVRETWGYACPNCKSDEHLQVELTTMANLMADGTDPVGDQEWDENSFMRCTNCNHDDKAARFYPEETQA
jgi:hypothetical protein